MDTLSRIAFSNSLVDPDQPISLKVTESKDGKFQLALVIGILAAEVPLIDNPSGDIKLKFRDAVVDKELYLRGKGNIALSRIADNNGFSNFAVVISGVGGSKIPGTGSDFVKADISNMTDALFSND